DFRTGFPRPARGRVVFPELLDVDPVDLPERGPFEPPVQLAFLDRRGPSMAAAVASIRGGLPFDRRGGRANRLAMVAERLERNPARGVRVPGAVLVHNLADLLRARGEIPHEGLHLRVPIRLRCRDDPDVGRKPVEDPAEVLPVVLDPIRVTSEGIGHVDEAPPGVLPTVLLRELRDLGLLGLPFILRIEDEALERVPAVLVQAAGEKLGERDFAPQPADMLEAADAEARVDDDLPLSAE